LGKKRTSLELFKLKRTLKTLASKEGRGTELVSLYVPPGRQLSDVMNMLRQEYGTASNIKSKQHEKMFKMPLSKFSNALDFSRKFPKTDL